MPTLHHALLFVVVRSRTWCDTFSTCSIRINSSGLPTSIIVVRPPPSASSTLLMQTHPPSPQPGNGSHSRLCCSSLRPSAYHAVPSGGVQLEGGDALSHSSHPRDQPELSPPEIDHSPTTDLSTLINLAGRLQPFLLPGYRWLGQEDLKIVGTRHIDSGGFADVWVGEMGDRKIAVKSYRCYASANCTSIYNVSHPEPLWT